MLITQQSGSGNAEQESRNLLGVLAVRSTRNVVSSVNIVVDEVFTEENCSAPDVASSMHTPALFPIFALCSAQLSGCWFNDG